MRDVIIRIRVNEEEAQVLKKAAEDRSLSLSSWARTTLLKEVKCDPSTKTP